MARTLSSLSWARTAPAYPQPIARIAISAVRVCVLISSTPACVSAEQPRLRDHLYRLSRVSPLQLCGRPAALLVELEHDRVSDAGREGDRRARVRRGSVVGPVVDHRHAVDRE